mgnify:CR=1 FL=1
MAWLYLWRRTHDEDYLKYVRVLSIVFAINFALGAATGTLVEFGLLDIWPTSLILLAAPGFLPLNYEATIAFIGEAALLGLYVAVLGKWSFRSVFAVLAGVWVLGSLSGYFILTVNARMNVPWGIGNVAHLLYPFLSTYGPQAIYITGTLNLAALLMNYTLGSSHSRALALSNVNFAQMVGEFFNNLYLPFTNPNSFMITIHTLLAAYATGVGAVALALSYKCCGRCIISPRPTHAGSAGRSRGLLLHYPGEVLTIHCQ